MRTLCLAALVCLGLLSTLPAQAATVRPPSLVAIDNLIDDDPRTAIVAARAQLGAAGGPAERFWALLGLARAQTMLELSAEAEKSLADAETALAALAGATPAHRAWLEKVKLDSEWMALETRGARDRMERLQQTARSIDDAELACELRQLDLVLLVDVDTLDEAWLTAEAVERCARELGMPSAEASALLAMGTIAGRGQARTQAEADQHFERALKVLGAQPARMARSLVLWERANAMGIARHWDESARWFEQARELSRSIGDSAGIAAANTGLAEAYNQRKQPAKALPLVAEARRLVEDTDTGYRMFVLAEQSIVALTLLRRAEVIAEIGRARRWDTPAVPAAARARVARAMAAGFASQGRFAQAYAETQRAELLHEEDRAFAADVQTLRLQARYAAAQRDAENTELRHLGERARLALEAETAKQRSLWAAIATLGLMTVAALVFGWRTFLRRRALADLALRDELTGAPNRRAVKAYAQAQLDQARRLDVPLTLALIDLDHFKRVNDTLGHAIGDAVLCALATSAAAVLRGQDRLGRWGGEEWLLVMPGTSVDEVPAVFERLRQRFAQTVAAGVEGAHGCTFSMGAAAMSRQTDSLDTLIAECDRQLYRAKREGRDRLRFTP